MRVSTSMAFEMGAAGIAQQQFELMKTQQQVASGKRVVTASDDPIAAARVVQVASSKSLNEQYLANQISARQDISFVESSLGQATEIMQDIRTLIIQAGDGAYGNGERADVAQEIRVRTEQLLALVNSRDASGRYVFAGFQEGNAPFRVTAGGVVFQGDEGRRDLQVANGRSLKTTLSAIDVFERVATGNGVFATAAAAGNNGSGRIDLGEVANASLLDGHTYTVSFNVAGGVTTYDITDNTTSTVISTGNPYSPDASIGVAGMQARVGGEPAHGDRFTFAPSGNKNIFDALNESVTLLNTAANGAPARARLGMGLADIMAHVDRTLDQVSRSRTEAGVALGDLDRIEAAASGLDIGYAQELSQLQDLDYTKAVSELLKQQTAVEAAQKAFVKVMGRSLFDLI